MATTNLEKNRTGISENLGDLINDRAKELGNLNVEKAKGLNEEIIYLKRLENTKIPESVKADLDVRDKCLGLRNQKSYYKPIPYCIRKKVGGRKESVPKDKKAEVAAEFVEDVFWPKQENHISETRTHKKNQGNP